MRPVKQNRPGKKPQKKTNALGILTLALRAYGFFGTNPGMGTGSISTFCSMA